MDEQTAVRHGIFCSPLMAALSEAPVKNRRFALEWRDTFKEWQ